MMDRNDQLKPSLTQIKDASEQIMGPTFSINQKTLIDRISDCWVPLYHLTGYFLVSPFIAMDKFENNLVYPLLSPYSLM